MIEIYRIWRNEIAYRNYQYDERIKQSMCIMLSFEDD